MALCRYLEKLNLILKLLFALAMAGATVASFLILPAAGFQYPELARIFVWHFPCPILATVLLLLGSWFCFKYLKTRDPRWDERAGAAHEIGYIFCLLTMATGILFSEVQWGAWWQWDPRQTSFLVVLLIYAAYFVIRGSFHDAERKAAHSGAYALAALLPALFLIFGYPRLPQVQSFHPNDSIMSGNIKGDYGYVVLAIMALFAVLTVWLYRLRVRAGLLGIDSELTNERLAIGDDPTPSGVVRRISVSDQDRESG